MENEILNKLDRIEKAVTTKEKPFLTLNQLSEYLVISRNTLYQLTSKSLIPHYKVGKKLMFKVSEIDEWVLNENNKIKSQEEIESEVDAQILNERL
jgi:excisionase family DNA binding protein